eukprot:3123203-Pleurochrysis_carterae.AAC.1
MIWRLQVLAQLLECRPSLSASYEACGALWALCSFELENSTPRTQPSDAATQLTLLFLCGLSRV